ncbi:MAG: AMP-binding protein [Bacteroidetes bacterium]|nr:AMP-binding protein [Bacteroidota bacterium]
MFELRYQSYHFSKNQDLPNLEELPEFAQVAFTFCRDWLAGQETFTQQTSGSTGAPKLQVLSRAQMEASATATGAFFGNSSSSQLLCCLNPAYIAGKMMLVRALVWECPISLVEPSSNPLLGMEGQFSFVALVPLQVEAILADEKSRKLLQSIPQVLIGGAALPYKTQQELVHHGIRAWQSFGMTETVSHIALAPIEEGEMLYQALPGVAIGINEQHCLWIQSPMSGKEKIQTNDIIELRSKNTFSWLGRADFVVNSGGIKLFPEQLERRIAWLLQETCPECAYFLFGEKDNRLGERLVLYVEGMVEENKRLALEAGLEQILEKYEVPKMIYFKPIFTYTPTGKINRPTTAASL